MKRRSFWIAPAIIFLCSMAGGMFGPQISPAAAASSEDDIKQSLRQFTRLLNLVEENFADKVTPDKAIYKGAIPGMARTLDPHTSFFDPKEYQLLKEDQRGHYYGVGMSVAPRNGKTIVIAPFPASPAYKAGIRPGDAIMIVNDKPTDNLSTTEVADLLKGERGTQVQVVVAREGSEKPLTFNIIRDEIPRKSVEDAHWIRPGVMYLDIQSFNENTSREVEANFKRLGENNVKGLILDLRENPGGLLNEGVAVADRFLQRGQTIVSHRGRSSPEKPYVARHGNSGFDYPIVVLVNRYSASAAEIVAGALQDHDRGWILGEGTFGKGLVQTVYPMAENTGLALTTAHFYTPSGRLIQRDYSNTSFYNYYYRRDTDVKNPLDVKMTDSGRTVYGGGGIAPDEKWTAPKLNPFQIEIYRKFGFFNFTAKYFGGHDLKLPRNWEPDQAIISDFHKFLLDAGVKFTESDWAQNLTWVKEQLRREMYITAFGVEESRKLAVDTDPLVLRAIESIPKARALQENAKKVVAQRSEEQAPRNRGR
ncbi:MAG TPA: S41 family peptidase [Bryobacteraceae bacterium]|nr:S41 family peptidase [Bryobacteraceae bacterium]